MEVQLIRCRCNSSTNAFKFASTLVHVALLKCIALKVATISACPTRRSTRFVVVILGRILGDDTGLVVAQVRAATAAHCGALGVLKAFRRAGGHLAGRRAI